MQRSIKNFFGPVLGKPNARTTRPQLPKSNWRPNIKPDLLPRGTSIKMGHHPCLMSPADASPKAGTQPPLASPHSMSGTLRRIGRTQRHPRSHTSNAADHGSSHRLPARRPRAPKWTRRAQSPFRETNIHAGFRSCDNLRVPFTNFFPSHLSYYIYGSVPTATPYLAPVGLTPDMSSRPHPHLRRY
jgi:hypothetical protein